MKNLVMSEEKPTQFKSMMLVKSAYQAPGNNFKASFSAMPITKDCPFVEVIFDPTTNKLGVVGMHKKDQFQFIPKLDGNGLPKRPNNAKVREQVEYIQERILMPVYHEYYVTDKKEIKKFLDMFVINPEFRWEAYWNKEFEIEQKQKAKAKKK